MSRSSPAFDDASGAVRRASGRVRKQPEAYAPSPTNSAKRKRGEDVQMPDDYVSDEDVPSGEDEPAEEEVREQKQTMRKPKGAAVKKPAQKKTKVNGAPLAIRTVAGGTQKKRATKPLKGGDVLDAKDAGGLYAQVYASNDALDVIAARWLNSFEEHEQNALADVVTFALKCAGCNVKITGDDVGDPDGATDRLSDIQKEYQATEPTDFPLHRKGKAGVAFKDTFSGFLQILIKSIAAKGVLYSEPILMDSVVNWFSPMSSAGSRAFRHTATVASLSVMTALCEVAADRANEAAATRRQAQAERSKKRVNKDRVVQLDDKVREITHVQHFVEVQIRDWFDTVFIHRYRDVDAVIRKECASALGDWIVILPDVFFDGQHLRYLGWVLSDSAPATRSEVIKQLLRLYREENKIAGLTTFTERFRSRFVEIATSDAESTVRASGIELLDVLREHGLLEPDDIDAVGRLIYESDQRVRKATARFFAEIVNDLYSSKIDDLGGLDSLVESLPVVDEGSFDTPRLEWLKFKALAEMLTSYDANDDLPGEIERRRADGGLVLHATSNESRFTLAAGALYNKIDDIKDWQGLSGYLLYDHSPSRKKAASGNMLLQLQRESALTEKEVFVLLEVISSSVKASLRDLHDKSLTSKSKTTKQQKEKLSEEEEDAARHLASLIPRLLKKFGDEPSTAAAVLRMEDVLDMPSLRGLHEDTVTYSTMLDNVRKQFMSHGTDDVLAPASKAIQHAKSYMELEDVTEEKIAALWDDVVNNLTELLDPAAVSVRGASNTEELRGLSNNLLRIIRLSQVSNCCPSLEDDNIATTNKASGTEYDGAIDYIIALVQRSIPADDVTLDLEDAELEDEVAARAAEAALRYLQWKLSLIIQTVSSGADAQIEYDELEALAVRRDTYVANLYSVIASRKAGEAVCVTMANYSLELLTSAMVLKTITVKPGMRDDWDALIVDLHKPHLKAIMKVFAAAEKNYAQLSGKKLEDAAARMEVDVDADPLDEDPLSDSEDEDEAQKIQTKTQASQHRRETKARDIILAEQTLCVLTRSLIYAVHAGVVDSKATSKRLTRNKARLGANYKEICGYLDIKQAAGKKGKAKSKAKGAAVNGMAGKGKTHPKSNAIVAEDEVEDDIEDVDDEDEEALQQRGLVDVGEGDGAEENGDENDAGAEVESVLGD